MKERPTSHEARPPINKNAKIQISHHNEGGRLPWDLESKNGCSPASLQASSLSTTLPPCSAKSEVSLRALVKVDPVILPARKVHQGFVTVCREQIRKGLGGKLWRRRWLQYSKVGPNPCCKVPCIGHDAPLMVLPLSDYSRHSANELDMVDGLVRGGPSASL